jgi:cytidylate kinase
MYRAVAWKALHDHVALDDEDAVARLAERASLDVGPGAINIDGHDVTRTIRTAEIDRAAGAVARLSKVRRVLVERQRREGAGGGIVVEGRDIGSVVFPNAQVKIFLDASPEERARRRAADPAHGVSHAEAAVDVATEMAARDRSARTRDASPLMKALDAVEIDTTPLSIEQTVDRVLSIVKQAME